MGIARRILLKKTVFVIGYIYKPPVRRIMIASVKDGLRPSGFTTFMCVHRRKHEQFEAGRFAE